MLHPKDKSIRNMIFQVTMTFKTLSSCRKAGHAVEMGEGRNYRLGHRAVNAYAHRIMTLETISERFKDVIEATSR
jgi:hypothetical protein